LEKVVTKEDRIKLFATAPKASAGTITQIEDGKMRTYWLGKLRGKFVADIGGRYKFDSRAEAVECARQFREHAKSEAARLGIAL
jgi:hypothetical protein